MDVASQSDEASSGAAPQIANLRELFAQRDAIDAERAKLDAQIAETLKAERAADLVECKSIVELHGFTPADIFGHAGQRAPTKRANGNGSGKRKFGPAPILYRSPAGETWSGRGRQPRWMDAAIKTGATREQFRVAQPG